MELRLALTGCLALPLAAGGVLALFDVLALVLGLVR